MVSEVSGRPGGGGTLSRNAVKIALGSNGTRGAWGAFDLTISEDGLGRASEGWLSSSVGRGGVWTCARYERDRREREDAIRTMADAELDAGRSGQTGRRGG